MKKRSLSAPPRTEGQNLDINNYSRDYEFHEAIITITDWKMKITPPHKRFMVEAIQHRLAVPMMID